MTQARSGSVAVVGDATPIGDATPARVGQPRGASDNSVSYTFGNHIPPDADWYARRDLDEVDRGVREGRVRRVIFPAIDELLTGLMSGEIDAAAWLAAGVRIEFPERPPGDVGELGRVLLEAWQSNARRRRRAQVVAGLILSGIAILAAFILNLLAR